MPHRVLMVMPLLVLPRCGSGGDESESPPEGGGPCEPPAVALPDGSCIRSGIGPEACHEGFVHDGEYGCEPILPPEPCPPGLMAVPGETECRAVMPCGEGTWGDLPVDSATEHVDASYAGGSSDGSAAAPWTTISDGVAAAAPEALVAVAAGSYLEEVTIWGKPIRLWGVCPEKVEIVNTGAGDPALHIRDGASGSEVGGLALRGAAHGLVLSGSEGVTVDRVWVHDTAGRGIMAQDDLGPTSGSVRGSLVEQSHTVGVYVFASHVAVEATVVRDTLPRASDQLFGAGLAIEPCGMQDGCDPAARAIATVRGSLVERNHLVGLFVMGSDVIVEASVFRDNLPQASDQNAGRGIHIQSASYGAPDTRANAIVRGSLVEQNRDTSLSVHASDVTIEDTVVRNTLPQASDQSLGRGISIQPACAEQNVCDPATRAIATVRGSLVEQNCDTGLFIGGSDVTVENTVLRDTLPQASDGLFGDGVTIVSPDVPASATFTGVLIAGSARAGLASFGAFVSLGSTRIQCSAFDLNCETHREYDFAFEDRGQNLCGCPAADDVCQAQSAGLTPPTVGE